MGMNELNGLHACRYMGYANEIGESFKSFISKVAYRSTYAAAISYGKSQVVDKCFSEFHLNNDPEKHPHVGKTYLRGCKLSIFQGIRPKIIPLLHVLIAVPTTRLSARFPETLVRAGLGDAVHKGMKAKQDWEGRDISISDASASSSCDSRYLEICETYFCYQTNVNSG